MVYGRCTVALLIPCTTGGAAGRPPSLEATLPARPQESIARRGFPPAWPSSPQVLALETCSGINKIRENSAMTGVVEGRMQHHGARKVTG